MVITYDVTKDIRFKQGEAVGIEKGKRQGVKEGIRQGIKEAKNAVIEKLLTVPGLSLRSVAKIADVPVSVVKRIKSKEVL